MSGLPGRATIRSRSGGLIPRSAGRRSSLPWFELRASCGTVSAPFLLCVRQVAPGAPKCVLISNLMECYAHRPER